MAYRNFSEIQVDGTDALATERLTPLEWLVVALARRDRLSSLDKPGRVATMLGTLFGSKPNPRLADPKLEALRRFAVLAINRKDGLPQEETARLLDAGFSRGQARLVFQSATSR